MQMQVTVELKNDLAITGILHSVDQYLNIKLTDTKVVNPAKYPHMVRARQRLGQACQQRPPAASPAASAAPASTPSIQITRQQHARWWCRTALLLCIALQQQGADSACLGVPVLQMSVHNCFIRGSVVRYVMVSALG